MTKNLTKKIENKGCVQLIGTYSDSDRSEMTLGSSAIAGLDQTLKQVKYEGRN